MYESRDVRRVTRDARSDPSVDTLWQQKVHRKTVYCLRNEKSTTLLAANTDAAKDDDDGQVEPSITMRSKGAAATLPPSPDQESLDGWRCQYLIRRHGSTHHCSAVSFADRSYIAHLFSTKTSGSVSVLSPVFHVPSPSPFAPLPRPRTRPRLPAPKSPSSLTPVLKNLVIDGQHIIVHNTKLDIG